MGKRLRYLFGVLAVLIFGLVWGLVVSSYREHQLQQEYREDIYFQTAIQLKWNVTILRALRQNKIAESIRYHEELVNTNLILLSDYGKDSTREYQKLIYDILAFTRDYRNQYKGPDVTSDVSNVLGKALALPGVDEKKEIRD